MLVEGTKIKVGNGKKPKKSFTDDQVAPEKTSQLDIFEKVGIPIADKCVEGKQIPFIKKNHFPAIHISLTFFIFRI